MLYDLSAAINTFVFLLDMRTLYPCSANSDLRTNGSLLYISYRLTSIVTVANIILDSTLPFEDIRVDFVGFR